MEDRTWKKTALRAPGRYAASSACFLYASVDEAQLSDAPHCSGAVYDSYDNYCADAGGNDVGNTRHTGVTTREACESVCTSDPACTGYEYYERAKRLMM